MINDKEFLEYAKVLKIFTALQIKHFEELNKAIMLF